MSLPRLSWNMDEHGIACISATDAEGRMFPLCDVWRKPAIERGGMTKEAARDFQVLATERICKAWNRDKGAAKWQPIETAPKDGTAILVSCDYDRPSKTRVTLAWHEQAMWVEAKHWADDADEWVFLECAFQVTHWMPLPDPPTPTAA